MSDAAVRADPSTPGELPRGRTAPLDPGEAERLFRQGEEREFYQGLIQVAAGLLHLRRQNARGARIKLAEGLAKLRPYEPAHRGIFVNELIGQATRLLTELDDGHLPYLIPPVIRFVDAENADFGR
jgi:hypothetical protein